MALDIVATAYGAKDCSGDNMVNIDRSSFQRNPETGCYAVQPHYHGIKLHYAGTAYYDKDCKQQGKAKPSVNGCYQIGGNSDIRGFKLD